MFIIWASMFEAKIAIQPENKYSRLQRLASEPCRSKKLMLSLPMIIQLDSFQSIESQGCGQLWNFNAISMSKEFLFFQFDFPTDTWNTKNTEIHE